jgi:hypothetical protein
MAYSIPANLPEQVDTARDLEISYASLHPRATIYDEQTKRTIRVPYESLANKYKDFLDKLVIEKELSDDLKRIWWHRPKTVSYDIYGTTELWSEILVLNKCTSIREFTPNVLRYYDRSRLKEYINEIYILEGLYK